MNLLNPMGRSANPEETIFAAALQRKTPAERAAYLDGACAGNPELRRSVEKLLLASEAAGTFLDQSPLAGGRPSGEADATVREEAIRLTRPDDEGPGTQIGRYKLLEKIGEGGFGEVFVAEQREPVKRKVALKVIKLGMDTRQVVARFEAERQALAMMDHPNIAKVLDAGATEAGRPYFVMELVRGIPITQYCDENQLTADDRLKLFILVCQAVQHAHQKGIIHRDLKPSNILVTLHDGVPVPKVIDFGIAKATQGELTDKTLHTQFQQFIGTPAYVSPEQAEMSGLDIDTRSDIYALGVLLYELLVGRTPFDGKEMLKAGLDSMRRTIREQEPVRPSTRLVTLDGAERTSVAKRRGSADVPKLAASLRGDVDWIVMKCLEKDRTRRYETANGLTMDIKRFLTQQPVEARPPSQIYRFQKMARRNKAALAAATLMVVVLAATTAISAWQAIRASRAESLAQQRLTESKAISKFLTDVFRSPDPARDGRTITVAETLGAAAKKLETDLASQPERRAHLQATLGQTYNALGLAHEAIPLQEKVRDYYLAASGQKQSILLWSIHELAGSYASVGRLDDGLKLLEEALKLGRKVNGSEHLDNFLTMNVLAASYAGAGRRDESLKLAEEALRLSRKMNGPEHGYTLSAMDSLAWSYAGAGRYNEAIKLGEEALNLQRKVNGPEHPVTFGSIHNLANCYEKAGHYSEALKLREEGVNLRRKVNGPEDPETLLAMHNLANSYGGTGRKSEGLKLREEVVNLHRKVNGPEHPYTLMAMHNLAWSYQEAGRRDEALRLREQTLKLMRKIIGLEHPETINAMAGLASSYADTGRHNESLDLREDVLKLRSKANGPEHPDTLEAMSDLAISYGLASRPDEARKLLKEASMINHAAFYIAGLQVWFGMDADYAGYRERMLKWAANTDQLSEARGTARLACLRPIPNSSLQEAALTLAQRAVKLMQTDPWLFYYQIDLGIAEYRSGHYPAAEQALLAAEKGAKDRPEGTSAAVVQGTAGFYRAMILFHQGKLPEATTLFAETEAAMKPLPSDEKNPLANGANTDDLLLWLAFKEAKALLNAAPATKP